MKNLKSLGLMALAFASSQTQAQADEKPNFLWLMTEDIARCHMAMFNENGWGAKTPVLDELAEYSVAYSNAYSNAPVSSAARSTLITSCYAPRLAVSLHRRIESVPLPAGLQMFPTYLREAGYHTTNASKTDYNCMLDEQAWDIVNAKPGAWRKREDKNAPFFHVRTYTGTHEGQLHFNAEKMNSNHTAYPLDKVNLSPEHQDSPLMRYTYAHLYDRIESADAELGKLIDMLKEDGEFDNTFIFFFGDNGGCLPGSKGYTTEKGLSVPLVVYVPEKWRARMDDLQLGEINDQLVSFMDFGPTLLNLAGISTPKNVDGKPFMRSDISPEKAIEQTKIWGYGDRFDELYTFNRTVRIGDFKYSRNFYPYHPKALHTFYRYKQLAFLEWREMFDKGELNAVQQRFFLPQGVEELYDLSVDPDETNNLANDPQFKKQLAKMRNEISKNMLNMRDIAFIPEYLWILEGKENPTAYTLSKQKDLKRYDKILALQTQTYDAKVEKQLLAYLQSDDEVDRLWAVNVALGFESSSALLSAISKLINDQSGAVRARAIVYLAKNKQLNNVNHEVLGALSSARNEAEALLILNDFAYLKSIGELLVIKEINVPFSSQSINERLKYIN